jgi:hypothetical protein
LSTYYNKNNTTKLYGKYRAITLDINDPEMRGRVLVQCPKLSNKSALGWAESCFPPGMFFLPKKGDFLWIEFEEGDIHKPVWVGIMPTRAYVRDYLQMGNGGYWLDAASIMFLQGDVNVSSSRDVYTRANRNINEWATNAVDVRGTYLQNNNYWSKDNIGQS